MVLTLIACILLFSVSCSPVSFDKGSVFVYSVGLDYLNSYFSPLRGTVNDACEFAFCLKDIYESHGIPHSAKIMISSGALASEENTLDYPSSDNVISALEEAEVQKTDLIVFFYSGHADKKPDGTTFLALGKTGDKEYSELELAKLLELLEAKDCPCVVVLDTCWAGVMAEYGDKTSGIIELPASNIGVIASSAANKKSYCMATDEHHGYLTHDLLKALGWEHDMDVTHSVFDNGSSKIPVKGYLKTVPKRLAVYELYLRIMENWKKYIQTPETNNTVKTIFLVPES